MASPALSDRPLSARSHPGWFGGVMGTAALATAAFRFPVDPGPLRSVAVVVGWTLLGLAIAGLAVIVAVNIARRGDLAEITLRVTSREQGPAYAAIPGSGLAIILALEAGLPDVQEVGFVAWALLSVTIVLAVADLLLTLMLFTSAISLRQALEPGAFSGVWFMPQTVLLLAATVLAHLSTRPETILADIAAPLAVLLMGAGFLMFLLVGSLVLGHLVTTPLQPVAGVPASWIMMSPSAAAALAFLSIPLTTPSLIGDPSSTVQPVMTLLAGALLGFSLWWLMVVVVLTASARGDALEFTPASWSFVFPLAVVAGVSGTLSRTWESSLMVGVAILMGLIALGVWLVVSTKSVRWLVAQMGQK